MKVFYPKVNLDYWHQKTDDGDRFADYLGDKYKKRPNLGRIFDFQYRLDYAQLLFKAKIAFMCG